MSALEAKISHDLAYYKYYDRIVSLYENRGELRTLIRDLKKVRQGMTGETIGENSSQNWSDSSKFDHSTACLVEWLSIAD